MEPVSPSGRKRPKLVWVVLLFYLFAAGYTAISFFLIYSGLIAVSPGEAAYFASLSIFDHTMTLGTAIFNLGGAISLFRLRRISFNLFATAFGLTILGTIVHAITKNLFAVLSGPMAFGMALGYCISITVCVYVWKLRARGILV